MDENDPILAAWWAAAPEADRDPAALGGDPAEILHRARIAEERLDLAAASELLAAAPEGPLAPIHSLLSARVRSHGADFDGLGAIAVEMEALAAASAGATAIAAWQLVARCHERAGRGEAFLGCLVTALGGCGRGSQIETRVLDGCGRALATLGAWTEARRCLLAVLVRRRAEADPIGEAITAGALALLELATDRPRSGVALLARCLAGSGDDLPVASRLRLRTLLAECEAAAGEVDPATLPALAATLERAADAPAHMRCFALLALARGGVDPRASLAAARDEARVPWLQRLVAVAQASLATCAARREGLAALCAADAPDDRATLDAALALARDDADPTPWLDRAWRCARAANQASMIEMVLGAGAALAPRWLEDRQLERYTGQDRAQLDRTARQDATMVFCDLADFTARSTELEPEAVIETVRACFELAAPLQADERVRPVDYLGDGLLAMATGDDHAARGLRFARRLVRLTDQVSLIRARLGERWPLHMRGGVASGPVVTGPLGSVHMRSYAAIGLTTNLAARLQGACAIGEVRYAGGPPPAPGGERCELEFKGFGGRMETWRWTSGLA